MTDDASFHHQQHAAPGVFNWEMVRKALRAAEEGVYCWDMESGEIFYTEQCLRMMGLPFQELAPNIFTESERTIHPEDRQFFRSSVQRYIDMPMAAASPNFVPGVSSCPVVMPPGKP